MPKVQNKLILKDGGNSVQLKSGINFTMNLHF